MKDSEPQFCMKYFRVVVAALTTLIVIVVGWTAWHCGNGPRRELELALAAAPQPSAPPIDVKAKMLHAYWGNCDKCHVTTGAGKPASMSGPPVAVAAPMTHDYWGNCRLCHEVTGGVQPAGNPAQAAAFNEITAQSLGLQLQTVTPAMKLQFGLISEDGVLVSNVQPNSVAFQSGIQRGDEILRVNKTPIESVNSFEAAIADLKPGSQALVAIYRDRGRNLFLQIPEFSPDPTLAATGQPPMTQNQIETLAEQLGVPKTQQSVAQALQRNSTGGVNQAAAVPPMSQNQIETMAEQLGVPKTQQSVTQALQRNSTGGVNHAAPAAPPLTQNQIETLAEQLGVPKTRQDVARALQKQNQGNTRLAMANPNVGKVAVGAMGPGLNDQVSTQFGASPYFIVFDPAQNTYSSVANPNLRSQTAQDVETGQYLVDLGVSNVIAGSFSSVAMGTLRTLRMTVYPGVTGPVGGVLSAYSLGQLVPMNTNPGLQLGGPTGAPSSAGVSSNPQRLF